MAEEKVENGISVLETQKDGESLFIELTSEDRETLVNNGRQFAEDFVQNTPEFSAWTQAGVEKVSSPVAFDPKDPDKDPYDKKSQGTKWHYKQTLRMTRSPV